MNLVNYLQHGLIILSYSWHMKPITVWSEYKIKSPYHAKNFES